MQVSSDPLEMHDYFSGGMIKFILIDDINQETVISLEAYKIICIFAQ